jgi:quinol monooxygenase YgiN
MVKTIIVHFWTLPKKEAEDQMKAILKEAKATYLKDAGTLDWLVMQDPKDSTAWSIVERYEDEAVRVISLSFPEQAIGRWLTIHLGL